MITAPLGSTSMAGRPRTKSYRQKLQERQREMAQVADPPFPRLSPRQQAAVSSSRRALLQYLTAIAPDDTLSVFGVVVTSLFADFVVATTAADGILGAVNMQLHTAGLELVNFAEIPPHETLSTSKKKRRWG